MSVLMVSFIYVYVLSLSSFGIIVKSNPSYINSQQLNSWISTWLTIVAIFFFSHNIWLAYFLTFVFIIYKKTAFIENHIYIFLFLLCSLPFMPKETSGMFGVRYFVQFNYPFFITVTLLLPLILLDRKKSNKKSSTEIALLSYLIVIISLNFRDNTITNALRGSLTDFVMIIVPYYALTKGLRTLSHLKSAFTALFYGIFPMAIIGIFESVKHWHLYDALSHVMTELPARLNRYDERAGLLRATATSAGPLIYGYIIVIALGISLFLKKYINPKYFRIIFVILLAGLISSVARGMWIGFIVLLVTFIMTGQAKIRTLSILGVTGLASLSLLSLSNFGQKIIDVMPVIGTTRSDTIDYRAELLEHSWVVFHKHPWFGSANYREDPTLEIMRQGQGIIDIVNSYIHIALSYGIIGLSLFLLTFFSLQLRTYRAIKSLPKEQDELILMGRMLLSIITAIMVMIFTVSSIDYIPIFYWVLVGLTAAYLNVTNETKKLT